MNKFIFIKRDLPQGNGKPKILKDEIGILEKVEGDYAFVNFVNAGEITKLSLSDIEEFDPKKTGDQYDKKICNICNRLLPVDEFSKNQNGKNNRTVRRPSCRSCRNLIDGENLDENEKREWNKVKPDLEIWECPICKKRTIPGLTSKVVLDHDHKTGKPRAWICDSCNTGLGRFKDNTDIIENAIKYLEKTKGQD